MEPLLEVKGLLIDMDGLLLDTERVSESCWLAAERETGFRLPEGFYHTLIGQSMRRIRERLPEVMDRACDVDQFMEVAGRIYRDTILQGELPLKPGARGLLEFLAERGLRRCLATSTGSDLCRHKLERTGLLELLPLRVCGDEVQHSKPDPDIYLEAARRLGEEPAELLVLEDSANGILAGLAAGCRVAHVPDIAAVPLAVQLRVDRVYRSLLEVTEALRRAEICFS